MANEGMGMAGGFAEAAGGVMSGFQYARQQQALEQQRKQQELQDAENRADSKMKRELLMKEIQNKEKAREIYAMDPVKDFGLDAKSFPNRDLYEAELSKHYAAEFRKAGLGEEAIKHESVGGQFYEQGLQKAGTKALSLILGGKTNEALNILDKTNFNIGNIQEIKDPKTGARSFQIIDNIEDKDGVGVPTVLQTVSAVELSGVLGNPDTVLDYMMKKQIQLDTQAANIDAEIAKERRMMKEGLGVYRAVPAGVDPAVKKQQDEALSEAAIFRTKDGTEIIVGEDLKVTKGLLQSGHNLASINKMRQKRGLPEIEIKSMSKDQLESMGRQYSGLNNEEMSSDRDIELGADWYGRISPQQKGEVLKSNAMGGKTTTTPNTPEVLTPMGGGTPTPTPEATKVSATPMNQPTDKPKNEPSIYDEKGLTKEERVRFDDLYNRTRRIGEFTGPDAMKQSQKAKDEFNELENLGQSRKKKKRNDNLSTQVGR
jgi:hypothetical protein